MSRSKVTDLEVSAFFECFLFWSLLKVMVGSEIQLDEVFVQYNENQMDKAKLYIVKDLTVLSSPVNIDGLFLLLHICPCQI